MRVANLVNQKRLGVKRVTIYVNIVTLEQGIMKVMLVEDDRSVKIEWMRLQILKVGWFGGMNYLSLHECLLIEYAL